MGDFKTRVSANGRIVIPMEIREQLGLTPGTDIFLRVEDGEIRILTRKALVERARARVAPYAPKDGSVVDEFLAERRAMWGEE